MTFEQLMGALITALIGGSGIVGVAVHYLKRYIDSRLEEEEQAAVLLVRCMILLLCGVRLGHRFFSREKYVVTEP